MATSSLRCSRVAHHRCAGAQRHINGKNRRVVTNGLFACRGADGCCCSERRTACARTVVMMPVVRGAGIFVAAPFATRASYQLRARAGCDPDDIAGLSRAKRNLHVCADQRCARGTDPAHTQPVFDWSAEFPVGHMRALATPTEWIAFGWGDRGFMLNTPTWSDLRPGTAIVALSGAGSGAMHVEYVETPTAYKSRASESRQPNTSGWWPTFAHRSCAIARMAGCDRSMRPAILRPMLRPSRRPRCCMQRTDSLALVSAGIRTAVWAPFDTAVFITCPTPASRADEVRWPSR